ncbi:hypothetical protein [Pallidibacillus thermolactis]|nr:hypothetical protein [Pallidibacillus thermolactis subsp. kokeshiiformis]
MGKVYVSTIDKEIFIENIYEDDMEVHKYAVRIGSCGPEELKQQK